MDIFPAWRDACLGTLEEKIAKFADPERRPALKDAIRHDWAAASARLGTRSPRSR